MTQSGESIDERRMVLCGIGFVAEDLQMLLNVSQKFVLLRIVAKFLSHQGLFSAPGTWVVL
jgi:hypothetical protein